MKVRFAGGSGLGRLILGGAELATVVLLAVAWLGAPPHARRAARPASGYLLCAAGDDDRMDDRGLDDWFDDSMFRDEEWTQGAGIMDLWRVDRMWRRVEGADRRPKAAPIPMTPKIFDPQQRWLRIPGLRNSRLRQAESSGVDIFRYRDSIFAWSGEHWYRSERGTKTYHAIDASELPPEILAVPVWVWRHYPREWAEGPDSPAPQPDRERRGGS